MTGFSRHEVVPTATNSLEAVAQWRMGGMHGAGPLMSDLGKWAGVPIRLRIEMEDATLFSFRFVKVEATSMKHDDAVTFSRRSPAAPYILQNQRVRAVWAKNMSTSPTPRSGVVVEGAAVGSSPVRIRAHPFSVM